MNIYGDTILRIYIMNKLSIKTLQLDSSNQYISIWYKLFILHNRFMDIKTIFDVNGIYK